MPNRKISQLQANANLTVSDIFPIVNSGTTKKQDIQGLLNFLTPYFSGNTELYITGGTYSAGTAVFTNNTGGTFSVSGFSTGSSFTGGTVSGATRFTNGLTASTISATTYQNLPLDIMVTGGTYDENSRVATFTNSTGGTFEVSGFYKPLWYAEPSSTPNTQPSVGGTNSIAIGDSANASSDNMFVIGEESGGSADNISGANLIGYRAGRSATNSINSNFIGYQAGFEAGNSYSSNFLGYQAGYQSIESYSSNFLGYQAGYQTQNARNANFIGYQAGINMDGGGEFCNFLGYQAGAFSDKTSYSTFIGYQAGSGTSSNYSIIIGHKAALNSAGSIDNNNIVIGSNITLPTGSRNQINIGGVLFGKNTNSNVETNPIYSAKTDGAIGINVVNPQANLHIGPSTTDQALMRLEVGPAPLSPNDGDIWLESNTLTGLKIRISGVTRTINIS